MFSKWGNQYENKGRRRENRGTDRKRVEREREQGGRK